MALRIQERAGSVRIPVRAQPRSARSEVIGEHDGALKVRVTSAPVDGEANRELVRLLARLFGVPRSGVRVVAGGSARDKVVEVDGIDGARAMDLLSR